MMVHRLFDGRSGDVGPNVSILLFFVCVWVKINKCRVEGSLAAWKQLMRRCKGPHVSAVTRCVLCTFTNYINAKQELLVSS